MVLRQQKEGRDLGPSLPVYYLNPRDSITDRDISVRVNENRSGPRSYDGYSPLIKITPGESRNFLLTSEPTFTKLSSISSASVNL